VIPTVVLDRVATPGGDMVLSRRGDQFSIRVGRVELMNSRNHASEDELGRRACTLVGDRTDARVLVGGLGLGYTLRAVLDGCRAAIDVVELVPAVVRWNREHTGALAGHPLDDPRVTVIEDDVARVIAAADASYHAIVLDVDNGPDELFDENAKLYQRRGLVAAHRALVPGGGLAVWSAFESKTFTTWLRTTGFAAEVIRVNAHGARHVIWLARSI
jgi:spermidine synthase